MRRIRWIAGGLVGCALVACGPLQSTSFMMDAEALIQQAKAANAEKYAPYEWTSATLYLHKAKEEAGYSDYEQAVDFAQKASKFAGQARQAALKARSRDPMPSSAAPGAP